MYCILVTYMFCLVKILQNNNSFFGVGRYRRSAELCILMFALHNDYSKIRPFFSTVVEQWKQFLLRSFADVQTQI